MKVRVEDLQDALRAGMIGSIELLKAMDDFDVSGVERTIYPEIRSRALDYLNSLGYGDLVRTPGFIVIGEAGIEGTRKRADGFICDPETELPRYAIEVGMGGGDKFWSDYNKAIKTWADHNLDGVFILFFSDSSTDEVLKFDGAELRSPRNPSFRILPLVMPREPDFAAAQRSISASRYYERSVGPYSRYLLVIGTRGESEARRLVVDPLREFLSSQQLFLQPMFFNPEKPSEPGAIIENLRDRPPLSIVFPGADKPLEAYSDAPCVELRDGISELMRSQEWRENPPAFILVGDYVDDRAWRSETAFWGLSPVVPVDSPRRNCWEARQRRVFGQTINPCEGYEDKWKFLGSKENTGVAGFLATQLHKSGTVEVEVELEGEGFPFIARRKEGAYVCSYLASGVGGWGSSWHGHDWEGYQRAWRILTGVERD